jgi:ribosome-binding factor A
MTRRTDRIGNLIQRELSEFILREVSDSRIGFVTISRVDVTTDLSFAQVHVSVLGEPKQIRDCMAALAHAATYMRTHLAKVMHMRTVPRLIFKEDKNLDHGFRIQTLLKKIEDEDKQSESSSSENREGDDTSNDGDSLKGEA